jgi:hypothetical protein
MRSNPRTKNRYRRFVPMRKLTASIYDSKRLRSTLLPRQLIELLRLPYDSYSGLHELTRTTITDQRRLPAVNAAGRSQQTSSRGVFKTAR